MISTSHKLLRVVPPGCIQAALYLAMPIADCRSRCLDPERDGAFAAAVDPGDGLRADALHVKGSHGEGLTRLTVTNGVAPVPHRTSSRKGLVATADAAFCKDRGAGKDTVESYA